MAVKLKFTEQRVTPPEEEHWEFKYKMPAEAERAMVTAWIIESAMSQVSPEARKRSKRYPDLTPKSWQRPQWVGNDCRHTKDLIDWFWLEHHRVGGTSFKDGLCQCESEEFIEQSLTPDMMRAFLTLGVFVDQLVHCHHRKLYDRFCNLFRYPKHHRCPSEEMANANGFLRLYNVYHLKLNWEVMAGVAEIIIPDTMRWLKQHEVDFDSREWVASHLYPEIHHVFEAKSAPYIYEVVKNIIVSDEACR